MDNGKLKKKSFQSSSRTWSYFSTLHKIFTLLLIILLLFTIQLAYKNRWSINKEQTNKLVKYISNQEFVKKVAQQHIKENYSLIPDNSYSIIPSQPKEQSQNIPSSDQPTSQVSISQLTEKQNITFSSLPLEEQIRQTLLDVATQDRYIIFNTANFQYTKMGFTRTYIYNMQKLNITSYFIGAQDLYTYEFCKDMKAPAVFLDSKLPLDHIGQWVDLQSVGKLQCESIVTQLGYHIIITEMDVFLLGNPIEFMREYPDIDIFGSSDIQHTTTDDDGLEKEMDFKISPGVLMVRSSGEKFLTKWYTQLKENFEQDKEPKWDQVLLDDMARAGPKDLVADRVYNMWTNAVGIPLRTATLNAAIFTDGHCYFVQKMAQRRGFRPMSIHICYTFGKLSKVHRAREEMLWYDDDQYYTPGPTTGYISFDMQVPQQMLIDSVPKNPRQGFKNFQGHFDMIHYQMKQLRNAMAFALLFNRTLIIDQFWSSADQFWYPHDGMPFEVFNMTLPFKAPLDQLIDIDQLYNRNLNFQECGPFIETKEYSYLKNPRVSQKIKNSRINIYTCRTENCQFDDPLRHDFLSPNILESQIRAIMEKHNRLSVWHFKDLQGDIFNGFEDGNLNQQFLNRMSKIAGAFCCARGEKEPSSGFYDPLFDIIPHNDKFGRHFNSTWKMLNWQHTEEECANLDPNNINDHMPQN